MVYDPAVMDHLKVVDKQHHSLIRRTIEAQLRFEPEVETRNRKPLKRPVEFNATWEIRFGSQNRFRVFYEVDRTNRQVEILAFGVKTGNRLKIGQEEIEL